MIPNPPLIIKQDYIVVSWCIDEHALHQSLNKGTCYSRGASEEDRTLILSLEGWCSTIELHLHIEGWWKHYHTLCDPYSFIYRSYLHLLDEVRTYLGAWSSLRFYGAHDGNRTRMVSLPMDFLATLCYHSLNIIGCSSNSIYYCALSRVFTRTIFQVSLVNLPFTITPLRSTYDIKL